MAPAGKAIALRNETTSTTISNAHHHRRSIVPRVRPRTPAYDQRDLNESSVDDRNGRFGCLRFFDVPDRAWLGGPEEVDDRRVTAINAGGRTSRPERRLSGDHTAAASTDCLYRLPGDPYSLQHPGAKRVILASHPDEHGSIERRLAQNMNLRVRKQAKGHHVL